MIIRVSDICNSSCKRDPATLNDSQGTPYNVVASVWLNCSRGDITGGSDGEHFSTVLSSSPRCLLSRPAPFFKTEHDVSLIFMIWECCSLMIAGSHYCQALNATQRPARTTPCFRNLPSSCGVHARLLLRALKGICLHQWAVKILSPLPKLLIGNEKSGSFVKRSWRELFAKTVLWGAHLYSSSKCVSLLHFIHSCSQAAFAMMDERMRYVIGEVVWSVSTVIFCSFCKKRCDVFIKCLQRNVHLYITRLCVKHFLLWEGKLFLRLTILYDHDTAHIFAVVLFETPSVCWGEESHGCDTFKDTLWTHMRHGDPA